MAANQQFLVCDNSTFANFSQWASAISAQLAATTWVQSTDTGQIMWTGLTISAVSMSGSNATYTYASLTGLPLAVGRALTITGCTNSGNNKTLVITSFTGTTSGTFTVVNSAGVTESGSSGVVTIATAVPGSGAYVYEIWNPNDGLTNFFLKMEYGNIVGTNTPTPRITVSTTTNGAGTCTGLATSALSMHYNSYTAPSTTTPWECDFSGAAGRFGGLLWRNAPNAAQGIFAIERSLNSSGAYTSGYVTIVVGGVPYNSNCPAFAQQSLVFGVGAGPTVTRSSSLYYSPALSIRSAYYLGISSSAFNGSIPFDTVTPSVGFFDYQMTMVGAGDSQDLIEGVPFVVTLYGASRTFMPTKAGYLDMCFTTTAPTGAICLRYD
jgi:hypothetical protein